MSVNVVCAEGSKGGRVGVGYDIVDEGEWHCVVWCVREGGMSCYQVGQSRYRATAAQVNAISREGGLGV